MSTSMWVNAVPARLRPPSAIAVGGLVIVAVPVPASTLIRMDLEDGQAIPPVSGPAGQSFAAATCLLQKVGDLTTAERTRHR